MVIKKSQMKLIALVLEYATKLVSACTMNVTYHCGCSVCGWMDVCVGGCVGGWMDGWMCV